MQTVLCGQCKTCFHLNLQANELANSKTVTFLFMCTRRYYSFAVWIAQFEEQMKGQRDFMHSSDVSVVVHGCPWSSILITLLFFALLFSSCVYFQGVQLLTLWHAPFIISVLFLMLQSFEFQQTCVLSKILLLVLISHPPIPPKICTVSLLCCKVQLQFYVQLLQSLSFSFTSIKLLFQKSWFKYPSEILGWSPECLKLMEVTVTEMVNQESSWVKNEVYLANCCGSYNVR